MRLTEKFAVITGAVRPVDGTTGAWRAQARITAPPPGSLLPDARTPGHENVPLQAIDKVASVAENKDIPLWGCRCSGSRRRQAVRMLQRTGYHITNMGGIAACSEKEEPIYAQHRCTGARQKKRPHL